MVASGVALAQSPAPADPSAEQRQKMAEIHRKMADCLVSERPIAECRAEMHASCQSMMGADGCPMMGMGPGMMGRGRMGGGMMPGAPPQPEADK
jgi:hypothetical protein